MAKICYPKFMGPFFNKEKSLGTFQCSLKVHDIHMLFVIFTSYHIVIIGTFFLLFAHNAVFDVCKKEDQLT